jgi:hypothetical protein
MSKFDTIDALNEVEEAIEKNGDSQYSTSNTGEQAPSSVNFISNNNCMPCSSVKKCGNIKCYWKHKSMFGKEIAFCDITRQGKFFRNDSHSIPGVEIYYPNFKFSEATGCLNVSCGDFVVLSPELKLFIWKHLPVEKKGILSGLELSLKNNKE